MRSKLWRILPLLAIPVALAFCGCGAREKQGLAHRNPAFRTDARESPTLARLVAEGKLPPLKERLPENPVVIKPFGPAAMYGGTLRMPISGYWDFGGIDTVHSCRLIRKEPVRDKDGKVIICADGRAKYELAGNLVESWKYSEDGREVTMKLRKGIRYSDGYPLKVDDLVYRWQIWNDTKLYNEISPVPAQRLQDQPIDLVKIDDYTFKFILPVVDFRWVEAAAIHLQFWEAPKHWLGQWDPNLNPEVKSWEEFKRRFGDWFDLSRPVLGPWRIVQWDSTTRLLAERNPYFYMTDEDGRQLPYIDRVDGIAVQNPDVAVMKVASGQVDLFDNGRLEDLPLLKINERRGDYKLQLLGEGPGSFPGFMINYWTLRDRLAEYFNKKEFRIALSIGINRAEINQLVFSGFGRPTNNSFGDWYRKIHAEYDPDRARAILDKLGLKDTTGNGLRNYPDGKDFTIVITTMLGPYASVAELVASHWRDLGINTIVNNVDGGQYALVRRERNFDLLTAHDGFYTYRED
ncbi:MAG: ABC transporter substrate-binding protein, partial [Kiritimatiellota bacterium]|nr:ABC transporter substrate-binding protein [Kiritimatiellota bacterium]